MSNVTHEINLALRTAAGHERAAHAAEAAGAKQYEMKMASAGASVYSAFVLAVKAAPEYQGRKIDDAAIKRIYSSTKARPWWDAHLKSVKVEGKAADREWGKRLIQWHLDPEAARSRRAAHAARLATGRKRLKERESRVSQGARAPQAAPSTAEMRTIARASTETALVGRELPSMANTDLVAHNDLLAELSRLRVAVNKVGEADLVTVLEILRVTVREVERYAP